MQPPMASTNLMSLTVRALSRLMAGHEMAATSGQARPCECDVCVCIRDVRAAYAAQCPDPETKSRILLRQWLSPEQLTQYDARGAFEVIGSKTGKRYRIEGRRQQNVCELDRKGRRIRGLCFMPEGRLATGDVMLCQKIALETDEERVMKVALPFQAETGLGRFVSLVAAFWGGA